MDNNRKRFRFVQAVLENAKFTRNPEARVATFNRILDVWQNLCNVALSGNERKLAIWDAVKTVSPKLHSNLLTRGLNNQKGVSFLFSYVFPDSVCPNCGRPLSGSPFCGRRCHLEYTTGYSHHLQDPANRERIAQQHFIRTGYRNPSQNPEIKRKKANTATQNYGGVGFASPKLLKMVQDTLEEKTGYRHHMKDPNFREQFFRYLKDTTGFSNPGANPAVIEKRSRSYFLKTGYTSPGANPEVIAKRQESYFRKTGYRNPWQNPEVRSKAKRTLIARTGFDNPLANPETFAKAMKSQHRIKEGHYAGRHYKYQGWENVVFERLVDLYGLSSVLTQFDAAFPSCWKDTGTVPDLFVIPKNTWVEVKSTYTLHGTKAQNTLYKNKRKARAQMKAGVLVTWVVVLNPKHKSYVVLPSDWHMLSRKALLNYIKSKDTAQKADTEAELSTKYGPRAKPEFFKELQPLRTPVYGPVIFEFRGRALEGVLDRSSSGYEFRWSSPKGAILTWKLRSFPNHKFYRK